MSNVVEYSLNDIVGFNKDVKQMGKYKKDGNESQLRTVDVQKYFEAKGVNIAKPRCYPEVALEGGRKKGEGNEEAINQ